ncbi:unnamed protein product, partial [Ectocarpus sp. 12 AP-2014]
VPFCSQTYPIVFKAYPFLFSGDPPADCQNVNQQPTAYRTPHSPDLFPLTLEIFKYARQHRSSPLSSHPPPPIWCLASLKTEEVPVFLPPMKCTTYRAVREAMHTNLVSALQVVTNRYTDGDGNVGKEITSDYILETMQAEIDKQSELAMRGLGRAMFSKGLPPARHSLPVGPGEIMETMTYTDVYGCHPTAPYH